MNCQISEEIPAPMPVQKCCLLGICWFKFIFCWYWWILIILTVLIPVLILLIRAIISELFKRRRFYRKGQQIRKRMKARVAQ
jgi:hypothetical protein